MKVAERTRKKPLRAPRPTESQNPPTQERKRHININKFFRWLPGRGGGLPTGWGGGLPTGGQGSKVYVLCAEPKEHKRFRPGTRPGGIGFPAGRIGDRGDREIVYVPNVYVPFPAPTNNKKKNSKNPENPDYPQNRGRGSGGVKSTGVSQSVRETSRDESQNVLSTQKLFKTRDLELPNF